MVVSGSKSLPKVDSGYSIYQKKVYDNHNLLPTPRWDSSHGSRVGGVLWRRVFSTFRFARQFHAAATAPHSARTESEYSKANPEGGPHSQNPLISKIKPGYPAGPG